MTSLKSGFILGSLVFVMACGGDPGGSTGAGSTGSVTEASATGGVTSGGPVTSETGEVTTGDESGSGGQGQTEAGGESSGTGSTGGTSTGGVGTSTGEPGPGSTGADLCAGFEAPGCLDKGCPEGQDCKMVPDECVSSDCTCEPGTGEIICSPDCGGGSCVPACPDVLCDLFCEDGFKMDGNGCDICECNEPEVCGCTKDDDCVKTSSGCCPCNEGGNEVPAHKNCVDQVMKCDLPPDQIACGQVFLCTDVQPACVQGQCVLQ